MVKILKKLTALAVALTMIFTCIPVAFAGADYSVEDAYEECAALYPEFVNEIVGAGASEKQIVTFLETVQEYLLGLDVEITEANLEVYLIDAVNYSITFRKNIAVRDALVKAFPEAVVDGIDGIINPDFRPIFETVKLIIFEHGLLDDGSEETEETPTEEGTEKETVEPTEPETEKPTEKETEEPTEEKGDKPSTGGNTGGSGNGGGGNTGNSNFGGGNDKDVEDEPVEIPTQPKVQFSDMEQAAWAKEAVYALVDRGIISGYPDGTFLPNQSITRAEFAKIIVLASGNYDKNATCTFTDVKTTDWFYSYVASAYKLGYITGRSAEIFDPNSNITRADLCTIVYRFVKSINPQIKAAGALTIADANLIPSYALEAVTVLNTNKVADALADNKFEPLTNATRAQCAQIVYGATNLALGLKTK